MFHHCAIVSSLRHHLPLFVLICRPSGGDLGPRALDVGAGPPRARRRVPGLGPDARPVSWEARGSLRVIGSCEIWTLYFQIFYLFSEVIKPIKIMLFPHYLSISTQYNETKKNNGVRRSFLFIGLWVNHLEGLPWPDNRGLSRPRPWS